MRVALRRGGGLLGVTEARSGVDGTGVSGEGGTVGVSDRSVGESGSFLVSFGSNILSTRASLSGEGEGAGARGAAGWLGTTGAVGTAGTLGAAEGGGTAGGLGAA